MFLVKDLREALLFPSNPHLSFPGLGKCDYKPIFDIPEKINIGWSCLFLARLCVQVTDRDNGEILLIGAVKFLIQVRLERQTGSFAVIHLTFSSLPYNKSSLARAALTTKTCFS